MSKSNAFVVMTNGYCEKSYRLGCLLDRSSIEILACGFSFDASLFLHTAKKALQSPNPNPSQGLN